MIWKVSHCCCGCSLKTGAIIIGVCYGVLGFCGMVYELHNTNRSGRVSRKEQPLAHEYIPALTLMAYVILNILLVVGVRRDKPLFLKMWVMFSIVNFSLYTVVVGLLAVLSFAYSFPTTAIGLVIGVVLYSVVGFYSVLVVNSLYREMQADLINPTANTPA